MNTIISVDPFKCRPWSLHDRLGSEINEQTCKSEIESFRQHGQLVPALARRLNDDPKHEYELIYGARRLFVAQHLNKELLIDVQELSDRDGIIAMDIENRLRKDISPYERGMSYARWIRAGLFDSQDDIAAALGMSKSHVSRLMRLARLPAVVVGAFRNASDICESWGLEVMDALEDPVRRASTIRTARGLTNTHPRPAAGDVYRKLVASSVRGPRPKPEIHDRVVLDDDGEPLFRVRYQSNTIVMMLPEKKVTSDCLELIKAMLITVLEPPEEAEAEEEAPRQKKSPFRSTPRGAALAEAL